MIAGPGERAGAEYAWIRLFWERGSGRSHHKRVLDEISIYNRLRPCYISQILERLYLFPNFQAQPIRLGGTEMNDEQLRYFRELLQGRVDELLGHADATVVDMTDSKDNFPDPTDRASVESDRNFILRLRDRERKLIGKIKEAMERIDDGTFGICEECGEEIAIKRLEARPVTTLCIECKTKQEANEKARGE